MVMTARRIRLLLRIFLALLLVVAALVGSAFYLLQRNPKALTQHFLDELSTRTGMAFHVEGVDVVLLPIPSIAVSNASVEGKDLHFSVAYATLRPDFLALLRGEFLPRNMTLLRPRLQGVVPLPLAGLAEGSLPLMAGEGNGLPPLPGDCRMSIVQGEARITGSDHVRLEVDGLQCRLDTEGPFAVSGRLQVGAAFLQRGEDVLLRLESFLAEGESDLQKPLVSTPKLLVSGMLHWPRRLERLALSLDLYGGRAGWTAHADLRGDLIKDDLALPFSLTGTAHMRDDTSMINLDRIQLGLGADSGEVNAVLRLPGALQDFAAGPPQQQQGYSLSGRLLLHRASLTQWLGFARNLAPGLQLALDNVTDGSLDFHLDGQGLVLPRIAVSCVGARFTGSGGVASWARPEVALDLTTEQVDLGLAIPEAVGKPPVAPRFFHAPLTPLPGEPLKPGEIGVDYDIRLAATRVKYGPLLLDKAKVLIEPGKMDKNGLEDTLLMAEGRLYGGSVRGECILGGGKELPYAIKVRFREVDGAPLGKAMPVLPIKGGHLQADVDIMSQGRELDEFLGKLRGTVSARGQQGSLQLPDGTGSLGFTDLDVELKLRSAVWEKSRLGLDGQWRGSLDSADVSGQGALNGRLWFSGEGGSGNVDFQNLPGSLSARVSPALTSLPAALQAEVSGDFSCQGARSQLTLSNAHVAALGIEARGQGQISSGKGGLAWQGSVAASSRDLGRSLHMAFNSTAKLPPGLSKLSLEADFKGNPDMLTLSNINAHLDQSTVKGSLTVSTRKKQLALDFALAVDAFDLSRYIKDNDKKNKNNKGKEAAPRPGGTWNFAFMRAFNAKGELRVAELSGWKVKAQDVKLPVRLENGLLTCGPNTGSLYGAPLHSKGSIDFTKGLRFESVLAVEDFDLTAASRERGGEAALGGRASLSSEVQGALTGPGQLPAALNGQWRFAVRNGSYQKRGGDGELKGKPTLFDVASASGNITSGMVRSDDFILQGPDLKVHGGGWIDLTKENLDCTFTVNMKGLPDFPLRLYGSLDNSKTSIGAGKLILNTIGGITKGFVDVLGGIVEGTWKLFR